jgi:hypothetical protein
MSYSIDMQIFRFNKYLCKVQQKVCMLIEDE